MNMLSQGTHDVEGFIFLCIVRISIALAASECQVPLHLQGSYFSMESGANVDTTIDVNTIERVDFHGECVDRKDADEMDADGHHHSSILFHDSGSDCYMCYQLEYRTPNIVQYKMSTCAGAVDRQAPSIDDVCDTISKTSDFYTFFKKTYTIVNCKNTFEGVFYFNYEWNYGGGGVCNSPESRIIACQEPGSQYVDNQVFSMNFGKCPELTTSEKKSIRFQCLGSWKDSAERVWSAVEDLGAEVLKERYRCLLTTFGQEEGNNWRRYSMSWWADCAELKSPYEGPLRLLLQPVVGDSQLFIPTCNFPTNYSGHWYHAGERDVDVDINATHIYFKTKIDEFNYKESYFTCLMNFGTRFLAMAVTVGKCEIDYVCFDMLPRHHSIIRWRMGKPYRLTVVERAFPNYQGYMLNQACSFYSFTLDRENTDWNYKTFLLNPPAPIECPIRGRYSFRQTGPETELIRTRIRGITERPRHNIDCEHYVSEWKSCDDNPTKISLDASYCETVDHTGRPIGEYDMPDWELTCIGYWGEDWTSYMITWDPEDPTSAFRCWAYEREDWRFVTVSRSTNAFCRPSQRPWSADPAVGASLNMRLTENERLYDDCAQGYQSGNPFLKQTLYYPSGRSGGANVATHRGVTSLALAWLVHTLLPRKIG